MRKRSLSVAFARAPSIEEMTKKFEGVSSEVDESDSEEEIEEIADDAPNAGWGVADYRKLFEQLRTVLPRKDTKKYQITLKKIPWEKVVVEGHSEEDVKQTTAQLAEKARKFRTLTEIMGDMEQLSLELNSVGKPKHPLTAYNLFVKEKFTALKAKHPNASAPEMMKMLSQEFAILSEKKKKKYEAVAAAAKEQYKQELAQFYRDNPNAAPVKKKKAKKESTPRKAKKVRQPTAITPFGLFRDEKQGEMDEITGLALRKLWDELDVQQKVKYIQRAFQSQSDQTGTVKLKLTKEEQSMLQVAAGKPEPIPRSVSDYYLKRYTEHDPSMSLAAWRKDKLAEYRALPKVRKLQLEIEYRHAKQEYVTKYQEYITNLEDETERQAEIEQLRTFIKSKLDKEEKQQLDNRPFQSLVESNEVYDVTQPIAESTIISVPKENKKEKKNKASKKIGGEGASLAAPPPAPAPAAADLGSPIPKPIKSILKSPTPKRVHQEVVSDEAAVPSPKKKKKVSVASSESDSNTEKQANNTSSKASSAAVDSNGRTGKRKEPPRPPKNLLEYYRQFHYLGKDEKCEESFRNLSTHRKETLKAEMRAAKQKYFKDLQKYLKTVPKEGLTKYLAKMEREKAEARLNATSDEESVSAATVAKKIPKEEPNDSDSDEEEEEEEETTTTTATTGTNGNNDDDDDDDDDDDSSDE